MASSITVFNPIGGYQFKDYKNIKEFEIDNEYKVERFEKVKTKFEPSILYNLEEYKVHLTRRFVSKLDDKILKDLNKNNNLRLVYKGLKDENM